MSMMGGEPRTVQRLHADLDGDGRKERIVVIGQSMPQLRPCSITPAKLIVFERTGRKWQEACTFVDRIPTIPGALYGREFRADTPVVADDINGDGRLEIIFKTIYPRPVSLPHCVHVLSYGNGVCTSIIDQEIKYNAGGGILIEDIDPKFPGKEIIWWDLSWCYGYEIAPPVFHLHFLGWNGHRYVTYSDQALTITRKKKYEKVSSGKDRWGEGCSDVDAYLLELNKALAKMLDKLRKKRRNVSLAQ